MRHAACHVKHIENLGPGSVFAFVSDTENKMQAVWASFQLKYPWLVVLSWASHCDKLLLADLSKHTLLAMGLTFRNNMNQSWRYHLTPKQILELCQTSEYGAVRQLKLPGATRGKSQVTAAECLIKAQAVMEKAAVDASFRSLCLWSQTKAQRDAVAEAVQQIKDEANWDAAALAEKVLKPVTMALDAGQRDTGGLRLVKHSFFLLERHFNSFSCPATAAGRQLKHYCFSCLATRRTYLIRPVHTLAYLLDPRFSHTQEQPNGNEIGEAVALHKVLSEAHDTRAALLEANETDASKLPTACPRPASTNIMGEYTEFRSRTGGSFLMDTTWEERTIRNPLSWWQAWESHLPALLSISQKVMKPPLSLAAVERSFSNAAQMQGTPGTRIAHKRLHQLLYVYYTSRSLSQFPICLGNDKVDAPVLGLGEEAAEDTDTVGSDCEDGLDLLAAAAAMETVVMEGME